MSDVPLMHPMAAGYELHADREDIVLLLHGWTGTPPQMRPLADAIADAGYGVAVPLLAGHGTRIEDLVETTWRDWVRSALQAIDGVGDDRRLHVVGLSMGGLIAVLIAATGEVESLTTINAPIRVHDRRVRLGRFVRGSRRVLSGRERTYEPGFAAEYHHDYRDTPIGTIAELFDLVAGARRALPKVTAPSLVVQSLADRTVRASSAEVIVDGLENSSDRRLLWLEQSGHVATLDVEREFLAAEVIRRLGDT